MHIISVLGVWKCCEILSLHYMKSRQFFFLSTLVWAFMLSPLSLYKIPIRETVFPLNNNTKISLLQAGHNIENLLGIFFFGSFYRKEKSCIISKRNKLKDRGFPLFPPYFLPHYSPSRVCLQVNENQILLDHTFLF